MGACECAGCGDEKYAELSDGQRALNAFATFAENARIDFLIVYEIAVVPRLSGLFVLSFNPTYGYVSFPQMCPQPQRVSVCTSHI